MVTDYNPSMLRGSDDKAQNIRNAYKAQDFEKVIAEIGAGNSDSEMVFLRAMSNFKLKNFEASLNDFALLKKQNVSSLKPSYVYEIAYYEALALIGAEKYDLAQTQLESVKNDAQNPYHSLISDWDIFKLKVLKSK
jgi:hypothetical protein